MGGRRVLAAIAALAIGLVGAAPSPRGADAAAVPATATVRAVAINARFSMADDASYASFDAAMRRLFDRARPQLREDAPNLVVYPESIGLWTAFLGVRGAAARQATSAEQAIASLIAAYQPQIDLYATRFGVPPLDPAQAADPGAALDLRTLAWALADHMTRAYRDTFSGIAKDEGVWLVACTDKAPAEPTDDPAFLAVRDPEAPAASPTYRVPDDQPFFVNTCTLWNPAGDPVYEARKEYLVPLEQDLLDITAASTDEIGVVPTPVGRLGFTISAPAWAHEVTQRLEQLDMQVQLQPDANPGGIGSYGWANAPASLDNWQPDGWRMASWEQLSVSGSVEANVTPMATGTMLDFVMFDGQGHVMHQPRPADTPRRFVGTTTEPGYDAIAPWVDTARDWCPPDDPSLPLLDRRRALVDCSRQLEPGAAHAGDEVASVVAADLHLRRRGAPVLARCAGCAPPVHVAPSGGRQWTPAAATGPDGTVYVAYRDAVSTWDGVHTDGDVWLVRRPPDGPWSAPVRVDDGPASSNTPADGAWHPEIAVTPDGTVVVAYEDARASENVWVARSADGGRTFSPSVRVSTTGGAPTNGGARNGYQRLAVGPDGTLVLVYHGHGTANAAARVYATVSRDGGATWTDPVVVDDTPTVAVAGPDGPVEHGVGHAWRPAVTFTADGGVVVAWQDFRTRQNLVRVVRADRPGDLGQVPSRLVDPAAAGATYRTDATTEWVQQLTPALAADGEEVRLAWEDTTGGVGHVVVASSADGGRHFGPPRPVTAPAGGRQRFPRLAVRADGRWLAAFEQAAGDEGFAALVSTSRAGSRVWGAPAVIDGDGLAPVPVAGARSGPLVVWQDVTGWIGGAPRPATEQIAVAGLPAG